MLRPILGWRNIERENPQKLVQLGNQLRTKILSLILFGIRSQLQQLGQAQPKLFLQIFPHKFLHFLLDAPSLQHLQPPPAHLLNVFIPLILHHLPPYHQRHAHMRTRIKYKHLVPVLPHNYPYMIITGVSQHSLNLCHHVAVSKK